MDLKSEGEKTGKAQSGLDFITKFLKYIYENIASLKKVEGETVQLCGGCKISK